MQSQRYSAVSPYRLLPDGGIDYAHYRQVAQRERRHAQAAALDALGRGLRRAAAAIVRASRSMGRLRLLRTTVRG